MNTINAVAAVIHFDDLVFARKRADGEWIGRWEFPFYRIEEGEIPEEVLHREIREKLKVEIKVGDLLMTVEYDCPKYHLSMRCYLCTFVPIYPPYELLEEGVKTMLSRDEIRSLDWHPADKKIVEFLLQPDSDSILDGEPKSSPREPLNDAALEKAMKGIEKIYLSNTGDHADRAVLDSNLDDMMKYMDIIKDKRGDADELYLDFSGKVVSYLALWITIEIQNEICAYFKSGMRCGSSQYYKFVIAIRYCLDKLSKIESLKMNAEATEDVNRMKKLVNNFKYEFVAYKDMNGPLTKPSNKSGILAFLVTLLLIGLIVVFHILWIYYNTKK